MLSDRPTAHCTPPGCATCYDKEHNHDPLISEGNSRVGHRTPLSLNHIGSTLRKEQHHFCVFVPSRRRSRRNASGSIDLSKATRLKDAVFTCGRNPQWVVMALLTVAPNRRNLQQISLDISHTVFCSDFNGVNLTKVRDAIGETAYAEWLELDHLLAQLCESHLVRLKVLYNSQLPMYGMRARNCAESLLPEVIMRGTVDLIGQRSRW